MKAGPSYHQRYFQLKGYDSAKKAEVIKRRRGAYTAYVSSPFYDQLQLTISTINRFGTVAMALNLIPIASVFFTLTTSVGAALWASDIENKSSGTQPAAETDVTLGDDWGQKEVSGKKEL
jgi:hypothetical protein